MKKIAVFLLCTLGISAMYAQDEGNPFAQYGYKARVVNTIMGRSVVHDRQPVVAIGSVLFDTKTKAIVGDFEPDSAVQWLDPQTVSMYVADIGRFNTPDPLAEKYYHISPYAYCMNNPITNIDPDGREVWSTNDPEEIKRLLADLNRIYSANYGNEEDAFSFRTEERSRQVRTNPVELFSPSTWFAKPEYRTETYTAHVLVANDSFDWSKDEYTQAMKDIITDPYSIELKMMPDQNRSLLDGYGGGKDGRELFGKDNVSIQLSLQLANFDAKNPSKYGNHANTWTLGGVFMHESLYHFHQQGVIDNGRTVQIGDNYYTGAAIMRATYKTKTFGRFPNHPPNTFYKIGGK